MAGSWFGRGFGEVDKAPKPTAPRDGPERLWLKPGQEKKLLWCDEDPFCFNEHQLRIDGDWRNWFTCIAGLHPACPLCVGGDRRSFVGAFTVVDLTGWTDREGQLRDKGKKLLYVGKVDSLLRLKKQRERRGGLVGCVYTVFRSTSKKASVGDDLDFIERVALEEASAKLGMPLPDLTPYNYEQLFAPKTPKELEPLTVWIMKRDGQGQGQSQAQGQAQGQGQNPGGFQGGYQNQGDNGAPDDDVPY